MPDAILLDSNVVVWWQLENSTRLGSAARAILESDEFALYVSAVTPWELQIKNRKRGRSLLTPDHADHLSKAGLIHLPITARDGIVAGALPLHHKDPFDRMLVAQCMTNDLMLMSADRDMHRYDIEVFPAAL